MSMVPPDSRQDTMAFEHSIDKNTGDCPMLTLVYGSYLTGFGASRTALGDGIL